MTIVGIGSDIVAIARIQKLFNRYPEAFPKRILSPQELSEFDNISQKEAFLAKRFAVKEAMAKALGTGFRANEVCFREIQVKHDSLGKPYCECLGATRKTQEKLGVCDIHISISDEKAYAVAFIILVGRSERPH